MPRSRVVTADTFEKLLARLAPERQRAGEEYENLRRRLTSYLRQVLERCIRHDSNQA